VRLAPGLALALALSACAGDIAPTPPAVQMHEEKADPSIRFIGFAQPHGQARLSYFLRSWLDKMTGIVEHQLYVEDAFNEDWQYWRTATGEDGDNLRVVYITKNVASCAEGCKFGAQLPDAALRTHPRGYSLTFHGRDGREETITVTARQIATQLAAVDEKRAALGR